MLSNDANKKMVKRDTNKKIPVFLLLCFFASLLFALSGFVFMANQNSVSSSWDAGSLVAQAQNYDYAPLAPLPPPTITLEGNDLAKFLKTLFWFAIVGAGILAVLMITIGGLRYTASEAFGEKQAAKNQITMALVGFLLAISSVLILETINPDLLKFNLTLRKFTETDFTTTSGVRGHAFCYQEKPLPGLIGYISFRGPWDDNNRCTVERTRFGEEHPTWTTTACFSVSGIETGILETCSSRIAGGGEDVTTAQDDAIRAAIAADERIDVPCTGGEGANFTNCTIIADLGSLRSLGYIAENICTAVISGGGVQASGNCGTGGINYGTENTDYLCCAIPK